MIFFVLGSVLKESILMLITVQEQKDLFYIHVFVIILKIIYFSITFFYIARMYLQNLNY